MKYSWSDKGKKESVLIHWDREHQEGRQGYRTLGESWFISVPTFTLQQQLKCYSTGISYSKGLLGVCLHSKELLLSFMSVGIYCSRPKTMKSHRPLYRRPTRLQPLYYSDHFSSASSSLAQTEQLTTHMGKKNSQQSSTPCIQNVRKMNKNFKH